MITIIIAEIGARRKAIQKKDPKIKTTGGRPRKYYYTEETDEDEAEETEEGLDDTQTVNQEKHLEHELYPKVWVFLENEFRVHGQSDNEHKIHGKRIDERRSLKTYGKDANKWLHPDLVVMEDLTADWDGEVQECVRDYPDKKARLWSFEVKLRISRSNIRKWFFQTVSNSSWANYGYLVAAELDDEATRELQMLSALHGIGFILLNPENPVESQVLIPARERAIDWDAASRLAEVNPDFKDYIKAVAYFCQKGRIRAIDWDNKKK